MNPKTFTILLLLLGLCRTLPAQRNPQPNFRNNATNSSQRIGYFKESKADLVPIQQINYWIEKDKSLSLSSIIDKSKSSPTTDPLDVRVSPDWAVWVKFKLPPDLDSTEGYFLSVGEFDEITLYYPLEERTYGWYKNGKFVKPTERVVDNIPIVFPITNPKENRPFWVQIVHFNPLEKSPVQLNVLKADGYNRVSFKINRHNALNNLMIGLIGGLLIAFLIYPIIFRFFNRNNYYLYYSAYIFFNITLLIYTSEKYSDLDIFFSYHPWTLIHLEPTFYVSTGIFYFIFLRNFILSIIKSRSINLLLNFLIAFEISLFILDSVQKLFFNNVNFTYKIIEWCIIPLVVVSFFLAYKLFYLNNKVLRYIAIGIVTVLFGQVLLYIVCNINIQPGSLFKNQNIAFLICVVIELFFFSLALSQANDDFREKQFTNELSLKTKIISLEKSALQAQMNPHFIFNCLNSIQNFILKNDQKNAVEYLSKFAKLVRHNLNASVQGEISLEEEVNMLENYLSLEQQRFENKFDFEINVDERLNNQYIEFPPMLIQPYVENAVKHGISENGKKGEIKINFNLNDDFLMTTIIDNGNGIVKQNSHDNKTHKSFGMGITQKRLELLEPKNKEAVRISNILDNQGDVAGTSVNISIKIKKTKL